MLGLALQSVVACARIPIFATHAPVCARAGSVRDYEKQLWCYEQLKILAQTGAFVANVAMLQAKGYQ